MSQTMPAGPEKIDRGENRDPWSDRLGGMRCRTCCFYVRKEPFEIGSAPKEIGRCRRNAPTMRGFPAVFPDDWCGEHKIDENRT